MFSRFLSKRSDQRDDTFWCLVAATALVVCVIVWTSRVYGIATISSHADGYYNSLTEGFRQGHLHTALEPQAALLALPDPYDPVANAPFRVHDMSLKDGHYYLYFGVAPVLLLFLPFRCLTGLFLTEPAAVALFTSLGLIGVVATLDRARRVWYPRLPLYLAVALVFALGFGSPPLLLNQAASFYQVPIACAYALLMGGIYCVTRFLEDAKTPRLGWLWSAGIFLGLTQAARPNYVVALSSLAIPALWSVRRGLPSPRDWRVWMRPMVAAFLPVVVVGSGLLVYNQQRFGNPFEFGMHYQLAGERFRSLKPMGLEFLLPHAAIYLWQPVAWLPHFPFVMAPTVHPFGALRYLSLMWMGLVALALSWRAARTTMSAPQQVLIFFLSLFAVLNLSLNCCFFGDPVGRYLTDFVPAFLLLGALGCAELVTWRPRLGPLCFALTLPGICLVGALYIQNLPVAHQPHALIRASNRVAATLEPWLGVRYGTLHLKIELPKQRGQESNIQETLLQTGRTPDQRDWVELHYDDEHTVRFGLFHAGYGETLSAPVTVPADGVLEVSYLSSALLPPPEHPYWTGWQPNEIADVRRRVELRVGGKTLLQLALAAYPSGPTDLLLGERRTGNQSQAAFTGKILQIERERPVPSKTAFGRTFLPNGALVATLQFPPAASGYEPLINLRNGAHSQLLYVIYLAPGRIALGFDTMGSGALLSRPVDVAPEKLHTLTLWLGRWQGGELDDRRIFAQLDQTVAFDVEGLDQGNDGSPALLGINALGFGSASQEFSGRILSVTSCDPKTLPPPPDGHRGVLNLSIMLPQEAVGRKQPLLNTGYGQEGDLIFLVYTDSTHIQVGHYHFSPASLSEPVSLSEPFKVNYAERQEVELSVGPAVIPAQSLGKRSRVTVRWNGKTVFSADEPFYPSRPRQNLVGMRAAGSSSYEAYFSGQVLESHWNKPE